MTRLIMSLTCMGTLPSKHSCGRAAPKARSRRGSATGGGTPLPRAAASQVRASGLRGAFDGCCARVAPFDQTMTPLSAAVSDARRGRHHLSHTAAARSLSFTASFALPSLFIARAFGVRGTRRCLTRVVRRRLPRLLLRRFDRSFRPRPEERERIRRGRGVFG